MLLARALAADIPEVQTALAELGQVLPDAMQTLAPNPADVALVGIGLVAFSLAGGTFLLTRQTGTGFALLAAATVGWFLFPYAQVPWASVFSDVDQQTLTAPATAWVISGLIVAAATAELVLSAREDVLTSLREVGLAPAAGLAGPLTRRRTLALLGQTLAIGGGVALVYGLWRHRLTFGLLAEPHLVIVPAVAGLVAGLAVWLAARSR